MSLEVRDSAEQTKVYIKNYLIKNNLVDPKSYVDGLGDESFGGTCFVLGVQQEYSREIEALKNEQGPEKAIQFAIEKTWNYIGLGMIAAQEQLAAGKRFYELNDQAKFAGYANVFTEGLCLSYALKGDNTNKLVNLLTTMITNCYDDMLKTNPSVMTDRFEQTGFFEAFFYAGYNVILNKKKKNFFAKIFG